MWDKYFSRGQEGIGKQLESLDATYIAMSDSILLLFGTAGNEIASIATKERIGEMLTEIWDAAEQEVGSAEFWASEADDIVSWGLKVKRSDLSVRDYNLKIKHVLRKLHAAADMLSWPSNADKGKEDNQNLTLLLPELFVHLTIDRPTYNCWNLPPYPNLNYGMPRIE